MPLRRVNGGWKVEGQPHIFKRRSQALKQLAAIHAAKQKKK